MKGFHEVFALNVKSLSFQFEEKGRKRWDWNYRWDYDGRIEMQMIVFSGIIFLAGLWNVPIHTDYFYLRPVLKESLAVSNLPPKKS